MEKYELLKRVFDDYTNQLVKITARKLEIQVMFEDCSEMIQKLAQMLDKEKTKKESEE